jgi:hypothetical protein
VVLTAAAILVHGFHPYVEDAEIYVPGIKKALNPTLYRHNADFFVAHARMTVFPNVIAASVRVTRLPLDWALFLWQFVCIFSLLLASWRIGRLAFCDPCASWGGVVAVASLLTVPVAGTALYIMDQYVSTRALSTPATLFILVHAAEHKWGRAGLWAVFTAAVHPLMAGFALIYVALYAWLEHPFTTMRPLPSAAGACALLFPLGLFPPVTDAYREILQSRSYFFLLRWEWYEWVGIFAPLLLLEWFRRLARRQGLAILGRMCGAAIWFGVFFFVSALVITIPERLARLAELQPMRSLQLLYILLFTFAGGWLAQFVLKNHVWRWLFLFVPICAGMFYSQRELFPSTPHVELPGVPPRNTWVQAFLWIRQNTPPEAYFALDPEYMRAPGEDQHGFRAIAERSRLADRVKDSGVASMFPPLSETWRGQVRSLAGWKNFQRPDFERLRRQYGVEWVVVHQPRAAGLTCPYQNSEVLVCRID